MRSPRSTGARTGAKAPLLKYQTHKEESLDQSDSLHEYLIGGLFVFGIIATIVAMIVELVIVFKG